MYQYKECMKHQWIMYCHKKCGNLKCKKDYVLDCFGIGRRNFKEELDEDFWESVKVNKKWKICSGCKTTYVIVLGAVKRNHGYRDINSNARNCKN